MTLDFGWNSKKFRISGAKQKKRKKKNQTTKQAETPHDTLLLYT